MVLVHGLGRLEVDKLRFAPCLPAEWKGFKLYYRYRETSCEIDVRQQPEGENGTIMTIDPDTFQDRSG